MDTRNLHDLMVHFSSDSYNTYRRKCAINDLAYLLQTLGALPIHRQWWYKAYR